MAVEMFRMYEQYSKDIKFSELQNPEETWELLDIVGEGTYGEVYSAKNKHTGKGFLFLFIAWPKKQLPVFPLTWRKILGSRSENLFIFCQFFVCRFQGKIVLRCLVFNKITIKPINTEE